MGMNGRGDGSSRRARRVSVGLPSLASVVSFAALTGLLLALSASDARAEIVFFSTGRTLSVREHRIDPSDDEKLILMLRNGGEIVCAPGVIDRIVPDEVPYPEPQAEESVQVMAVPTPSAPVKYGEIIDKVAAEHNVPANLVRAVIQVE